MALVKVENKQSQSSWTKRDKRATRHNIPGDVDRPVIDYEKLRTLCAIEGLKERSKQDPSSDEAHQHFMRNYRQIFVTPEKLKGVPCHLDKRREQQASELSLVSLTSTGGDSKAVVAGDATLAHKEPAKTCEPESKEESHNIRDHMALLHKQRRSEEPKAVLAERTKTMRRILRKLPFERTAADNDQLYNTVKHFTTLSGQVTPAVLKELCVVAQLDAWRDEDITVFGNTGLHLVLKGTVRPYNTPVMKHRGVKLEVPVPTPEPQFDLPAVSVGECFGTLEKVEGRDANSKILTVTTMEPNCDFLKISCTDYKRVIEQIHTREQTEKINLMQSCKTYKLWSKQPLQRMADLFRAIKFPPNTVLVSEGYQSPFLAIIKQGECHVLRQVEILQTLPNGQKERKHRQVVMGKMCASDSFGEVSVVAEEPMSCSIVTATEVHLAYIEAKYLKTLDEVTVQLLLQSSEKTYAQVSQDDIHDEYIKQERKREWNEYKHNMVVEVINKKGIRPGYGKWSKD